MVALAAEMFDKCNNVASDHFWSRRLFSTRRDNDRVQFCVVWLWDNPIKLWISSGDQNYVSFFNLATVPQSYSKILELINILRINWQIDMARFGEKFKCFDSLWLKCCEASWVVTRISKNTLEVKFLNNLF